MFVETVNTFLQLWKYDSKPLGQDPIVTLLHPVIDTYSPNKPVVAVLGMILFWRLLLNNVLPPLATGVDVVFSNNTCNQTFTYQIHGKVADYVGPADYHNPKYNYLKHEINLKKEFNENHSDQYSGVLFGDYQCQYTVSVYPTSELEAIVCDKCTCVLYTWSIIHFSIYRVSVYIV